MKKLIIVLAVGMMASDGMAQKNKKSVPPPPPPQELRDVPAPPPPPPAPSADFVQPPPPPPAPPKPAKIKFTPPVIVNEKGYAIVVKPTKEELIILLTKKGMTQKISMSVWNAKPEYFENKYGKLPPPPPPVPAPPPPAPPVLK